MQATLPRGTAQQQKGSLNATSIKAALILILVKGKALLFGLVKLKYLLTAVTAIFSVLAYAGMFGFAGALGFVLLIFVHEMGHVIVLRSQGVPASVPLFIPFVGAIIAMKAYPKGAVEEAHSAIAGPIMGSIGALACLAIYFATHNQLFAWLAYVGFFLNLFNLLPMSPLDGGRVVGAIWRGFWVLGLVAAVVAATWLQSPLLLLFAVFGLDEINRRYMRVHPACYGILGVLAVLSSLLYGEIFFGIIIAIFAVSHGRRVAMINKAALCNVGTKLMIGGAKWCPLRISYPQNAGAARGRKITRWQAAATEGASSQYFSVPKSQRIIIGSLYIGLASLLSGLMIWMHSAGLFTRPH